MADDEHVARFNEGAAAWNAWRAAHPHLAPDLSGAVLDGRSAVLRGPQPFDLDGATLANAHLAHLEFARDLSDVDLFKARLEHVVFHGTLRNVELRRSALTDVSFEDVTLAGSSLRGATISRSRFSRATFEPGDAPAEAGDDPARDGRRSWSLEYAECEYCDFQDARLNGVPVRAAQFRHCDLRGVDGLVVDDNVMRGSLESPQAGHAWAEMRRTYTGANMVFILLASIVFFLPWIGQSVLWVGMNRVEARALELVAALPIDPASRAALAASPTGIAGHSALACIEPAHPLVTASPSPAPAQPTGDPARGNCLPTWQLLLGWHEGWPAMLVSALLLFYNLLRLGLTFQVAPLAATPSRARLGVCRVCRSMSAS
ncbi:MAG: pentapeptide repeat-containing protein, partial [Gammaproteobacteria bacterium]